MTGVDLTQIDGIDEVTALKVISEIGLDMTRWPTGKHFASWLGLCPGNKVTGGKRYRMRSKPTANRAASALRLAAQGLVNSHSALGAYYRRMRTRLGAPKAMTATAHKLARLVYSMLRYGTAYVDAGQQAYEQKYRDRVLTNLQRKAKAFGYQLVHVEGIDSGVAVDALTWGSYLEVFVAQMLRSSAQREGDRIRRERCAKKNAWDSEAV